MLSQQDFGGPFNSLIVKHIINSLPEIKNGNSSILFLTGSLVAINFIVFDNFTWRGIAYIRLKYVPIIINNIIKNLMDYIHSNSHQFFQDSLSGKISKQITTLADSIERIITGVAANFLRATSLVLAAFIAAFFVNWIFTCVMMVWFILFAGISIYMSKKLVIFSDIQAKAESEVVGELVDSISNQSNVRIFAGKKYEITRMSPLFYNQQVSYQNKDFYALVMHSIQGGLIAILLAISSYFLFYFYRKDLITAGDFALILGLSVELGHMIWYTMSEVDEFNKAVGRCKQSLSALIVDIEIKDVDDAKNIIVTKGKIEFDSVKFHYKGAVPLFENKNITINSGEKIGLVGYSGSGKSSFVNLILRFYDVTEGRILIDGEDISKVTQESLRSNIAMIPQDPSMFHRSIMENIRYGRIDASDAEVIEAAQRAHAHEFITEIPEGYQAMVGEKGVKLSGGQRQRIAIARAFLKNAPLLILDEATSQLDSITEEKIQESSQELITPPKLRGTKQSKNLDRFAARAITTIVIAHRLSTLLNMDRILVFDKGKIVQDGTHKELIKRKGLYKTLWDAQVGGFLLSGQCSS